MKIDWNKYPPLPEAPMLPEWRDTPEREAYWEERCSFPGLPEWSYAILIAGMVLLIVGFGWIKGTRYCSAGWAMLLSGCILLLIFSVWILCRRIRIRRQLFRKYGFTMYKLNRPDVSGEIGKLLAGRPDFDESAFRTYWCDDKHLDIAQNILKNIKTEKETEIRWMPCSYSGG